MPEVSGAVRDTHRRPPFCYQTVATLAVVREAFTGQHRPLALAIYTTLTEVANEVGGEAARESFEATRKRIAELAGVSLQTLDRYVKRMEEFGLVEVERRQVGGVNLPNVWHLSDPPGSADHATPGSADHAPRARPGLSEEVKSEEKIPSGGELALAAPKQGARALSQTLVAYFVDESRKLGSDPPRRVTGQVAARVGEMLAEGITPDRIRRGIDALLLKRIDPRNLPALVQEASLRRRPMPRRDGSWSASEMLADGIADQRAGRP
jgi:hypothetical protein